MTPHTSRMTDAGLYIHVPFCESKCAYCDFYSTPNHGLRDRYLPALLSELQRRRDEIPQALFRTVYIGGGTPSSLPLRDLSRLLEALPLADASEITVEVNPEDVDSELAAMLAGSAVNRVSMGVQSLADSELQLIGRRHSAARAIEAYHTLRDNGIGNINLDLIFGLPGQTLESFHRSLERVLSLNPDHLSAYSLMLEPGTRLYARMITGKFRETDDEISDSMYRLLCSATANCGFEHYEISNFAKPGKRSLHNSSYWNLTPYLGLGPGAHSFDGSIRRYNPPSLKKYIESGGNITKIDPETATNRVNDYIMIRLRTADGLSLPETEHRFGSRVRRDLARSAEKFIDCGMLVTDGERLSIPEEHFLVSDSIISELMID